MTRFAWIIRVCIALAIGVIVALLPEGDRILGLREVFGPTLWWLAIPGMTICSILRLLFGQGLIIYSTGSVLEIALNAVFYCGLVCWVEFAAVPYSSAKVTEARFRCSWLLRVGLPLLLLGVFGLWHTSWLVKVLGWEGRDPAMSNEEIMSILLSFLCFCGGVLSVLGVMIILVRKLRRRRLLSSGPNVSFS